jgi:hypothetical protein
LLNALYFCVVTLATIGYGDLHPETRLGKVFTIIYIFVGVGTLGVFISTVARTTFRHSTFGALIDIEKTASNSPEREKDDSAG